MRLSIRILLFASALVTAVNAQWGYPWYQWYKYPVNLTRHDHWGKPGVFYVHRSEWKPMPMPSNNWIGQFGAGPGK
ncbi:hypothetical protein AAVH_31960 [Aphelenchoides avenae]|nr:hypothetical protein AAVH_31960 [Aphelenchus avenae]